MLKFSFLGFLQTFSEKYSKKSSKICKKTDPKANFEISSKTASKTDFRAYLMKFLMNFFKKSFKNGLLNLRQKDRDEKNSKFKKPRFLKPRFRESVLDKIKLNRVKPKLTLLPTEMVVFDDCQIRNQSQDQDLKKLAQSIKDYGVLNPIKVKKLENDVFEIVSGHRRFLAAKMAKLIKIPAIIVDECDKKLFLLFLAENLNCKKLNCFEEAEAIFKLIDEHRFTQQMICDSLGVDQSFVADRLKLLKIRPCVREKIILSNLDIGHALLIAMVDQESKQIEITDEIMADNLDVLKTKKLVFEYLNNLGLSQEKQNSKLAAKMTQENKNIDNKNIDKSETIYLVKDVRFFENTVLQVTKMMNKSGLEAVSTKHESGNFFEYTIKIPKEKVCTNIKNIKNLQDFKNNIKNTENIKKLSGF